jgi:hypothetical protein
MSRSCDHCEETPWKESPSLVGIEPLLQFAMDWFRQLGAHSVVKSVTLTFERLITEIEYRVGLLLLLGAYGLR